MPRQAANVNVESGQQHPPSTCGFQKHKDHPASEMGGFTRILHNNKPDQFMDEIPTFVAQPLPPGADQGYIVLNRALAQLRNSKITAKYRKALRSSWQRIDGVYSVLRVFHGAGVRRLNLLWAVV